MYDADTGVNEISFRHGCVRLSQVARYLLISFYWGPPLTSSVLAYPGQRGMRAGGGEFKVTR